MARILELLSAAGWEPTGPTSSRKTWDSGEDVECFFTDDGQTVDVEMLVDDARVETGPYSGDFSDAEFGGPGARFYTWVDYYVQQDSNRRYLPKVDPPTSVWARQTGPDESLDVLVDRLLS